MTAAGTILNNRYKILGLLSGQGGMGLVYQATDLNLQDTVVIKQSRFNDEAFMRQKFPELSGGNPSIRALRGGSYSNPGSCSCSTYRSFSVVLFFLRGAGFRVVVSARTL
jgi:serine/threonine protein kinase